MKETNLMPSPRLIGRCCPTDYLSSRITLLLLMFMLPMAIFSQELDSQEYKELKEANYQEWLRTQKGVSQNSVISHKEEISEYDAMLKKLKINEQKMLDYGFTKADIQAEMDRLVTLNDNPKVNTTSSINYYRTTAISDVCATAVPLTCAEEADGSTVGASNTGFINCGGAGPATGYGVWYKVIGNNYNNTVSVVTSDYNVRLHVYSSIGGDCSSIQCAGGTTGQGSSSVTFFAPFDDVFYIYVTGAGSGTGTFTLARTSEGECNDTPPGDGLSSDTAYTINCADIVTGNIVDAPTPTEVGTSCDAYVSPDRGVWYTFSSTLEDVTVSLCGPGTNGYDSTINVYTKDDSGNLLCVGGDDDYCSFWGPSQYSFSAYQDTQYYVYISGFGGSGDYEFQLICSGGTAPPPPSAPNNDLCPDAIEITCTGSDYTIQGTTIAATSEGEPPACDDTWSGVGVWYYIDGDGSTYELITCGYDTVISVYEAVNNQCGVFNCVTSDDIGNTAPDCSDAAIVTFETVEDQRYYIYVSSWSASAEANFDLRVSCIPPPEPPANDYCADAEPIACGGFASGNTTLATADSVPFCDSDAGTDTPGVWYSFTPADGEDWITASLVGITYDAVISIYEGGCNGLTCVIGENGDLSDDSEVTWLAESGTEYLIFVTGFFGATGAYELELSCSPDPCINAELISCADGQVTGSTSGASGFPVEQPACGSGGNQPGYMYELVGEGKFVDINTCGSNYDTNLNVYTGSCGNLQCVTGNDDWSESSAQCGALFRSRVGFFANEGQSYYIWVNGYNGFSGTSTGDFVLNISCDDPEPNDLCEDALRVSCGASIEGSTELSTGRDRPTDDCSGSSASEQGVWYIVTGTGGDIELSLCETTYDAKLLVFEGECGDLSCVAGNNDGSACGVYNQPFVTISTEYGQDYYVYVTGYNSTLGGTRVGDFTLNVDCLCTPGALEECVTLYHGYEDSVTLTAELQLADGDVTYQWSTGATTQSIEVSVEDANLNYSVTMEDESGCGATKTFFVYVVDVDCDRNDNSDKVELCHNGQSICVNWEAVDSHLAHGDTLGVCGTDTCGDAVPSCDSLLTSETTDVDINTTITWNAPSAGFVDYYVLSVGTTSGGTDVVDNENVGEVLSYNLSDLAYETTYYVSIVPYNANGPANAGCSESTFTTMPDPTPANNLCGNAQAITCQSGIIETPFMQYATDTDEPSTECLPYGEPFGGGVWYSLIGDGSDVTLNTNETNFDSTLSVYTGTCGSLICIAGDDDFSSTGDEEVEFNAEEGTTYYIYVGAYSSTLSSGTVSLEISCAEPPPPPGCNDINIVVTGGSYPSEVSWELRDSGGIAVASGGAYADTTVNLPDSNYTFFMFDSYGDGWNGATYTIKNGYNMIISTGTLSGGSSGNNPLTIDCANTQPPNCNDMTISVGGGSWISEVSWEIEGSGGIVASGAGGSTSANLPDGNYTIYLYDSYGDGWNGNTLTVVNGNGSTIASATLYGGSYGTQFFTVSCGSLRPAGDSNELAADWSMAPNPTKGNVTLDLTNYLQSDVTIDVMNVTGKVIYNTSLTNLKGSKYEVELNNSLPAGMYFVRVESSGQVSTKKLMIMR